MIFKLTKSPSRQIVKEEEASRLCRVEFMAAAFMADKKFHSPSATHQKEICEI